MGFAQSHYISCSVTLVPYDMSSKRSKYDRGAYNLSELAPDNIDRLTLERVPRNSKVLELGCATGYMSQYLIQQLNCKVTAIEFDAAAAKLARESGAKILVGDLNLPATWDRAQKDGPFDVVLASNIIEHLADTNFQLRSIHQALRKSGTVMIVVPNIAWWRSRWRLLQGIWKYEDFGLFDETHLKFFSLPSLRADLEKAGFTVEDEAYDPAGGAKWFTPLLKFFPNAYAYQVVMVARRK